MSEVDRLGAENRRLLGCLRACRQRATVHRDGSSGIAREGWDSIIRALDAAETTPSERVVAYLPAQSAAVGDRDVADFLRSMALHDD